MAEPRIEVRAAAVEIALIASSDLGAYKALRDRVLALHPEAFTSDATAESLKPASAYSARLGYERPEGGHFTLGAWRDRRLLGAISCERDMRMKVRHIGHVVGMMVREDARSRGVGRALLAACIARARAAEGLELLTLSVTATNVPAIRLYLSAGFARYGSLHHAIKVDGHYHDKDLMVLGL